MSEILEREHLVASSDDLGLLLDTERLLVANENGIEAKLTGKEFDVLKFLVFAYPQSLSADEMRQKVWGNFRVVAKALDVHLFRLRRKLAPLGYQVRYGLDERYVLERECLGSG